jgi:hypothetical protein
MSEVSERAAWVVPGLFLHPVAARERSERIEGA